MTTPRERARETPGAGREAEPTASPKPMAQPPTEPERRQPDPEEAPELLGERSDYPVQYGYGEDPGNL
jgi:hypothetical protein